jgi:hypothetical protein
LQQSRIIFRDQKLPHDIGQRQPRRQQAGDVKAGDVRNFAET